MAIPIVLPNSEDAEDSYRSLDLLLEQLMITLRQVLMHRRREAAANALSNIVRHRHVPSEPTPVQEQTSEQLERDRTDEAIRVSPELISDSLPLPDVVLDASADRGTSQEQKDTNRTRTTEKSGATTAATTTTGTSQTHSWSHVGADFKRLADQLLATNRLDQKDEEKAQVKDEKDEKDASLLSLFCPPLGGSIWTTVALLVGWGLLSRTR